MNSPTRTTLLMGLIAAASCSAAAWFYPWPAPPGDRLAVGQGLFAPFDQARVWGLEIVQYDPDQQLNQTLTLQRQGDRWLAPAHAGFPSDNTAQRSAVINSLIRLTEGAAVLQRISDSQEDHVKYGVVDPVDYQQLTNRAGIGKRVRLEDRNRRELATLVVGEALASEQGAKQAFVRIAGQPQVYLAEFDPAVLNVEFRNWIDPNLFGLRTQLRPDGELAREAVLTSAIAGAAAMGSAAPGEGAWRATLAFSSRGFALKTLEAPAASGWQPVDTASALASQLAAAANRLGMIPVDDVRAKPEPLANSLAGAIAGPAALYEPLKEPGFAQTAAEGEPLRLLSAGGQIEVLTESGIRLRMLLGNVFPAAQTESKLARFALLHAEAIADWHKPPEPPAGVDGAEPTDDQRRQFSRETEAWEAQKTSQAELARAFNARHSRWLYLIDESVVSLIMPPVAGLAPPATAPASSGNESPEGDPPATPPAQSAPDQENR